MIHCLLTKNIQPRAVQSRAALAGNSGHRDGEWEQRNWKGRRVRCSDSGAINILRRRRRGRAHVTHPPRRGGERGGEGRGGWELITQQSSSPDYSWSAVRSDWGHRGCWRGKRGGRESSEHLVYQRFISCHFVLSHRNANSDWTPVWPEYEPFSETEHCWVHLSGFHTVHTLIIKFHVDFVKHDRTLADRAETLQDIWPLA